MGWLAAQGAIMAIGLFVGLVCSVIGLFFGHIILFDSIALGIAAGVCCNQFTAIHPALCLVIGIATFLLLLWLQNTSINFVRLVSAAWQADTLAVFVKVIFLFRLRRPRAALVKWSHGQHDMTMGVAAACVMDIEVGAQSFRNKLRGTVFPDKPDLFLSG